MSELLDAVSQTLNARQLEAVASPAAGVLQVVAGPGTGKTRVLSARVAHLLLHDHIAPHHIIVTTFTKKAANEMKDRLRAMLAGAGVAVDRLVVGTFHSIAFRIVKRYGALVGVAGFSVADDKMAANVLHAVLGRISAHTWAAIAQLPAGALREYSVRNKADDADEPAEPAEPPPADEAPAPTTEAPPPSAPAPKEPPAGFFGRFKKMGQSRLPFFHLDTSKRETRKAPAPPTQPPPVKSEPSESVAPLTAAAGTPETAREPAPHSAAAGPVPMACDIKKLRRDISRLKANAVDEQQYKAGKHNPFLAMVYSMYQDALRESHMMDFDDCLLYCYKIISAHPVLKNVQHALVDEFQDTNEIQLRLLYEFSKGNGASNATVVGDPDQSIYAFRDAQAANFSKMRDFYEAQGQECRVVYLEDNYRSTADILNVSEQLMRQQAGRTKRTLTSHVDKSVKPIIQRLTSAKEEARWIAITISLLMGLEDQPLKYSDIAVLARTSSQMRVIERELTRGVIPYNLPRGKAFWEKPEVMDTIDCLRWVSSPNNKYAFERTINLGKKGFGPAKIRVIEQARSEGETFEETLWKVASGERSVGLGDNLRKYLREYLDSGEELRKNLSEKFPLVEETKRDVLGGFFVALYDTKLKEIYGEDEERYKNIMEVKTLLQEFEFPSEEPLPGLDSAEQKPTGPRDALHFVQTFIERIALYDTEPENETPQKDTSKVTISTIHGAKGLEWPVVFVAGLGEGLLPAAFAINGTEEAVDEERRCFYVAATRAKRLLFLSGFISSSDDTMWNRKVEKFSRFLKNLDPHIIEASELEHPKLLKDVHLLFGVEKTLLVKQMCMWYKRERRFVETRDSDETYEEKLIRRASSGKNYQLNVPSLAPKPRLPPSRVTSPSSRIGGKLKYAEDFTAEQTKGFQTGRSVYEKESFKKAIVDGQNLGLKPSEPSEAYLEAQLMRGFKPSCRTSPVLHDSGTRFDHFAKVKQEPSSPTPARKVTVKKEHVGKRPYTKPPKKPTGPLTTREMHPGGVNFANLSTANSNKAPTYVPDNTGKKRRLGTR